MTTIPDFGQAHETCGGVKLGYKCSGIPTSGQRKEIKENQKQ